MRSRLELTAVFAGGAVGTVLRAALAESLGTPNGSWPWPTFIANIIAAFALGWCVTMLIDHPRGHHRRLFLGTGVCGGLSTFSTMQVEIVRLFQHDYVLLGISYLVASIALGLLAVRVATTLARRWTVR